jgi:hypothetical protein
MDNSVERRVREQPAKGRRLLWRVALRPALALTVARFRSDIVSSRIRHISLQTKDRTQLCADLILARLARKNTSTGAPSATEIGRPDDH